MKPTVSAIVPFYNEEKSIGRVVRTLLTSPQISEIICVNDGSTDGSKKVLQQFNGQIKLINLPKNYGKGKAVAEGIKKAKGTHVFFCDADLVRFTKDHIEKILDPIVKGKTKVVLAVPTQDKTGRYPRWESFLAGERVYPRAELLHHLSRLSGSKGAGASEVYLNTLYKKKDTTIVPLVGLYKPLKVSKWNSTTALKQYLLSIIGVLQEAGKIEIHSVSDLKQLENLLQVDTFENLLTRITEIKNKKIRHLLERYYAKYLAKYVKKIKPPFLVA
ncbi:glycosyltransferase family 2 protein [Candidatus Gottesmanbacteria bacterium]|nr:glycosyltransferase family 2 protein [Candidatus Gottesmanbacteria bacterium]